MLQWCCLLKHDWHWHVWSKNDVCNIRTYVCSRRFCDVIVTNFAPHKQMFLRHVLGSENTAGKCRKMCNVYNCSHCYRQSAVEKMQDNYCKTLLETSRQLLSSVIASSHVRTFSRHVRHSLKHCLMWKPKRLVCLFFLVFGNCNWVIVRGVLIKIFLIH